jgi:Ni,Fe-hydrogenase I cytochrome b subunit
MVKKFVRLFHPCVGFLMIILFMQLYTPITSEEDMCPDVAFTAESKEYHSIAGLTRVTLILGNVLSSLL